MKVRITGADQAARVGADMIRAGDGGLKRRIFSAIRDATDGLERDIRASAITTLPKRGGLGPSVARAAIRKYPVYGGGAVGVTVSVRHKYDLQGLDDGTAIHPLFGNRRRWYTQRVRPGWFTRAVRGTEEHTRSLIEAACDRYLENL